MTSSTAESFGDAIKQMQVMHWELPVRLQREKDGRFAKISQALELYRQALQIIGHDELGNQVRYNNWHEAIEGNPRAKLINWRIG